MERIHSAAELPFDQIRFAAIAIRAIDEKQRHAGIFHVDSDAKTLQLLHLAMHCDLRNAGPSNAYLWIDPQVPAPRLRQVSAVCRQVWRSNGRDLPFGFSPPNDCFDEKTGKFLFGPTRFGLTCANFVLAVFQRAGLRLVNYETWPADRPGDKEWQTAIIQMLRDSGLASSQHLEAMEGEVANAAVRYRPEEVAGAALATSLPTSFEQVVEASALVLQRLIG